MPPRREGPVVRTAGRFAIAVVVFALASCTSDADEPADAAWLPVWEAERALVDDIAADVASGDERCNELLGDLRASRETLLPTPNEVLDESVESWLALAESLAFDCPSDADEVVERVHDLEVLRAEIDAGVVADQNP